MATPLLLYKADEASSGTTPTTVGDSSAGTALPLTITYGTGAAWKSIGAGKGIGWATSGNTGAVSGVLSGTKVETAMAGTTKATWEVVVDTGTNGGAQDIVHFGGAASNPLFNIAPNGGSAGISHLDLYACNALVGGYDLATGVHVLHFVVDTTQATAADRCVLYVDGSRVTLTGTSFPTQNVAIDATYSDYANILVSLGCFGDVSSIPMLGGSIYFAALYASALSSAQVSANAAVLAANNDADPNGGAAPPDSNALFFGAGV